MIQPDKLTIEEIECYKDMRDADMHVNVSEDLSKWIGVDDICKQLLDIMRENERIKGSALALILQAVPSGDKHTLIQNRHIKALAEAIKEKPTTTSIPDKAG